MFHKYGSTTASATSCVSSISLSYFQALIIILITSSCHTLTVHFVYRILFISYSNTALIIAEIVDAPVNIIVYHLTRLQEGLLDIKRSFGRCLKENEAILFGETFSLFSADLSPAVEIGLVADEHDHNVGITVLPDLFKPAGQMVEGLLACDIIDKEGTSCSSIVASCYTFERLLTSRIPNLKFYVFLIYFYSSGAEFYTNREVMLLTKSLISELQQ